MSSQKRIKLPKVSIDMGQDGETYSLYVDVGEGVSIRVDLDQTDVNYLKFQLETIEAVWGKRK